MTYISLCIEVLTKSIPRSAALCSKMSDARPEFSILKVEQNSIATQKPVPGSIAVFHALKIGEMSETHPVVVEIS